MNPNIFISTNNTVPHEIITGIQPNLNSINLNFEEDPQIKYLVDSAYLIVKAGTFFSNIELRVENEILRGISLFISKVDQSGQAIEWRKCLSFTSVGSYLGSQDSLTLFKYRWEVLNNKFLLSKCSTTAFLNVYSF